MITSSEETDEEDEANMSPGNREIMKLFRDQNIRLNSILRNQPLSREVDPDSHWALAASLMEALDEDRRLENTPLQLSEWMYKIPKKLDSEWLAVPSPKAERCLIVAQNGTTYVFKKNGTLLTYIRSQLPGGIRSSSRTPQQGELTILDAFYVREDNCFYALDIIAWDGENFIDYECDVRFFRLRRILEKHEVGFRTRFNRFPIKATPYSFCTRRHLIDLKMLLKVTYKFDGFLFYHKQSYYVHGENPAVLWLFPFMIEKLFKRSKDYNHFKYIQEFNEEHQQKKLHTSSIVKEECAILSQEDFISYQVAQFEERLDSAVVDHYMSQRLKK